MGDITLVEGLNWVKEVVAKLDQGYYDDILGQTDSLRDQLASIESEMDEFGKIVEENRGKLDTDEGRSAFFGATQRLIELGSQKENLQRAFIPRRSLMASLSQISQHFKGSLKVIDECLTLLQDLGLASVEQTEVSSTPEVNAAVDPEVPADSADDSANNLRKQFNLRKPTPLPDLDISHYAKIDFIICAATYLRGSSFSTLEIRDCLNDNHYPSLSRSDISTCCIHEVNPKRLNGKNSRPRYLERVGSHDKFKKNVRFRLSSEGIEYFKQSLQPLYNNLFVVEYDAASEEEVSEAMVSQTTDSVDASNNPEENLRKQLNLREAPSLEELDISSYFQIDFVICAAIHLGGTSFNTLDIDDCLKGRLSIGLNRTSISNACTHEVNPKRSAKKESRPRYLTKFGQHKKFMKNVRFKLTSEGRKHFEEELKGLYNTIFPEDKK